jgi:crossover junction endodeoxyribonuclease RuvC
MSPPTVVAFDLSLTSTGVADRNGTRRICPKSTGVERLAEVRDAVLDACHVHEDDADRFICGTGRRHCVDLPLVVIEGYSYGSGNSAHQVGELGGVVRLALHEAGIRYEVVPPASLKLYACGVGNAGKDDVLLAAVRRLGYEGKSKDEADALWLYALAMHALGEPIIEVPKAHLRALKALPWAVAGVAA